MTKNLVPVEESKESEPVVTYPFVMLNTGLRIGGSVALICSDFWECGGATAFFVEESSLRSTAFCPTCKVRHRVRPMVDAFADGMFAVGGLFGDAVDMQVNVPQLLVLLASSDRAGLLREVADLDLELARVLELDRIKRDRLASSPA